MIALGLRQVQEALNRKADQIQRDFVDLSDRMDEIGRKLLEVRGEERDKLRTEQLEMREQQKVLAEEVNQWRQRARDVSQQTGTDALRNFLEDLLELNEDFITAAAQHALYLIDAPEEELLKLSEEGGPKIAVQSAAGRLIERARIEYDLRGTDVAARQRAAVEFANRPGIAQDDSLVQEIEAAMEDEDPIVRETMVLTFIQLHRFRSMRVADLDIAHKSVQQLANLNHSAVIPILVEILSNPRTGFQYSESGAEEIDNNRSRMVALLRLVEWHTAEAQSAVKACVFDRDPHIVKAANRALELFPEIWNGKINSGN